MSVIIKDIQKSSKNNNEIIRVDVSDFKGMELIGIRIWYSTLENGEYVYKPTQKGVTFQLSEFSELQDAINRLANYINDRDTGSIPEQFTESAGGEETKGTDAK